jgi:hypothetical protein
MARPIIRDAPHGTVAGYEQGCRCEWCNRSGKHIAADGTPEPGPPPPQTPPIPGGGEAEERETSRSD